MNMKCGSEDTEQITVIDWASWNLQKYPELKWLHHCPNGGSRNKLEATKLKLLGVKPGVADLHLPYPKGYYCGLYIEMKYGKNKKQETQKEFLSDMAEAGHFVATCYSAKAAIAILEEYLSLEDWFGFGTGAAGDETVDIVIKNTRMNRPNNGIWGRVSGPGKAR